MEASEYLKKAKMICDVFEPDGCDKCPLKRLSCGLPEEDEEQVQALQLVEEFTTPPETYICPRCENEEHDINAKFCKICGLKIGCGGA